MNKKKTVIIVLVFLLLVISAILLTIKLFKIEKNTLETFSNTMVDNSNVNTVVEKEETNEESNNLNQNDINTKIDQEQTENKEDTEKQETSEEIKNSSKTNEEKAIEIVEKIWNNEKNIYCAFEEIDAEGNYIICVRDKETTRALCWYIVNIETGKAIIK